MFVNRVFLSGFLGADPDVRVMPSGDVACSFRIAVTERWTNQTNGQPGERTDWFNIVCYGKTGEIAAQYLHKGDNPMIEGTLRTRSYEQNGVTRYVTEIHVLPGGLKLPTRRDGNNQVPAQAAPAQAAPAQAAPAQAAPAQAAPAQAAPAQTMDFDDEIPF